MNTTRIVKIPKRPAFTLIETVLMIGIVAASVGLLLPAVMKARAAVLKSYSTNNIRQIILASHNYAHNNGGKFPSIYGNNYGTANDVSLFVAILPYMEGQNSLRELMGGPGVQEKPMKAYLDPADPTAIIEPPPIRSSYAANAYALREQRALPNGFPDGVSNTIGFACHYSRCQKTDYNIVMSGTGGMGFHRATFADNEDVGPLVTPTGTIANAENRTIQFAPSINDCDPHVPQSCYYGGMLVGYVDGSVKTFSSSAPSDSFWALVTPDGNEPAIE